MAVFDPFTWHDGDVIRDTPLSAENLNSLEQRIAEGFDAVSAPGSGGGGSGGGSGGVGLPRVVVGGVLGATPSLALTSGDREVWLTGVLNTDVVLTITGMASGQAVQLFLVQNPTVGGGTMTVVLGGVTQAVPISSESNSTSIVTVSFDGTDYWVATNS